MVMMAINFFVDDNNIHLDYHNGQILVPSILEPFIINFYLMFLINPVIDKTEALIRQDVYLGLLPAYAITHVNK